MDPIIIPGPPKEAFNKNRPMSELIKAQIKHLKHLEEKLPAELRAGLPKHQIITEDDAARYIGPVTKLLGQGFFSSQKPGVAADIIAAKKGTGKNTNSPKQKQDRKATRAGHSSKGSK